MTPKTEAARRDALDALILMGAEPEGAEATLRAIEAEAAAMMGQAVNRARDYQEAEAVKRWREALSAAMTHYEGSLAECGCEVATRARALLDEANHD